METFTKTFITESIQLLESLDQGTIEAFVSVFSELKERGRLFVLGVGGSAANASHWVNDFRKILGIETYAPTDNVAELSARTNDDGWDTVFTEWLKVSRLGAHDVVLVLSVGGGSVERNVSANLAFAVRFAKQRSAKVLAIVGRSDGEAARSADIAICLQPPDLSRTTPHTETMHVFLCHLFASHPKLVRRRVQKRGAIFLDRDGVLNLSVARDGISAAPRSSGEFVIDPAATAFVSGCAARGWFVACVSNQPDVARGKLSTAELHTMTNMLSAAVELNDIRMCTSADDADYRRKPNPGMLIELAREHNLDLERSFMIGDRWKDVEAGRRAGCRTILVDRNHAEPWRGAAPDYTVQTLDDALVIIEEATEAQRC